MVPPATFTRGAPDWPSRSSSAGSRILRRWSSHVRTRCIPLVCRRRPRTDSPGSTSDWVSSSTVSTALGRSIGPTLHRSRHGFRPGSTTSPLRMICRAWSTPWPISGSRASHTATRSFTVTFILATCSLTEAHGRWLIGRTHIEHRPRLTSRVRCWPSDIADFARAPPPRMHMPAAYVRQTPISTATRPFDQAHSTTSGSGPQQLAGCCSNASPRPPLPTNFDVNGSWVEEATPQRAHAAHHRPLCAEVEAATPLANEPVGHTIVSCTVAPPFRFDAFEHAPPGWSPTAEAPLATFPCPESLSDGGST